MNSCSNTGEERGEEVFDRIGATRCSQRQVTVLKMLKRREQQENQELQDVHPRSFRDPSAHSL